MTQRSQVRVPTGLLSIITLSKLFTVTVPRPTQPLVHSSQVGKLSNNLSYADRLTNFIYQVLNYVVYSSLLKIVSHCRRTLWDEGLNVVGWGIGGSVDLLLRVQSPFVETMGGG